MVYCLHSPTARQTIMGTTNYPLSVQIADTIEVHGVNWAHWHYCQNRRGPRLSVFEYRVMRIASIGA